jgi:hypothetical protein
MKHPATAVIVLAGALALSGCNWFRNSSVNPFNWFQSSEPTNEEIDAAVALAEREAALMDGRQLIPQVISLDVMPTQYGAVVTAVGLPPTQGWWAADLIPENDGFPVEGVVTFRFVVAPAPPGKRVSTQQSRELSAGAFLPRQRLPEIREIVVLGQEGSRSSRR